MCRGFLVLGLLLLTTQFVTAAITLTDQNSSVTIDDNPGMRWWMVDGVNQLYLQQWYFRIGNAGGQASLDSLPHSISQPLPDLAIETYTLAGQFTIQIETDLTGGVPGSHTSDIMESIRVNNISGAVLPLHLFQYTDFDLNGTSGNDTVVLANANAWKQSDPDGPVFSETVGAPAPNRWEAALYPSTYNNLNSGTTYNLNDFSGPLTGNATWTWQWDKNIGIGSSFLISKDKLLIPEPATLALLAVGFGLVVIKRRS